MIFAPLLFIMLTDVSSQPTQLLPLSVNATVNTNVSFTCSTFFDWDSISIHVNDSLSFAIFLRSGNNCSLVYLEQGRFSASRCFVNESAVNVTIHSIDKTFNQTTILCQVRKGGNLSEARSIINIIGSLSIFSTSDAATFGEPFTLTCMAATSVGALVWYEHTKPLQPAVIIGISNNGSCNFDGDPAADYVFMCDSMKGVYTMTIPGNLMTSSFHNTKWFCEDLFKGVHSNIYILSIIYRPLQVTLSPSTLSYTVQERTGSVGPVICTGNCTPDCTVTWSGPNLPPGTNSVLFLKNINRNQAGNYICTAENTISSKQSSTIKVLVEWEPGLNSDIPSSPKLIRLKLGMSLNITVNIIANPIPYVYWIFEQNNMTENITEITTSSFNGYHYTAILFIPSIESTQFGLYIVFASNSVGGFNRTFSVTLTNQNEFNSDSDNKLITAGIPAIIACILSLLSVAVFIFWFRARRLRKQRERSEAYVDLAASCNPKSIDSYDTLQQTTNIGKEEKHEEQEGDYIETYEQCEPPSENTVQSNSVGATSKDLKKNADIYTNID